VSSVALSGDVIVSGSWDKTVRVWDRLSGECLQILNGHGSWVSSVALSGDVIVSGSDDNTVRVWDSTSGTETRRWSNQSGERAWCYETTLGRWRHLGSEAWRDIIAVAYDPAGERHVTAPPNAIPMMDK
jgi:WD40 repeat protein